MTYLVDTNVSSEIRKGDAANVHVGDWLMRAADADDYIPAIPLGELRRVERVRHVETWRRRALSSSAWLDSTVYAGRVVPVDVRVADTWGRLQVHDPIHVLDGLLAATAIVHGFTRHPQRLWVKQAFRRNVLCWGLVLSRAL